MSVTDQSQPRRIPRNFRLGGYTISLETAAKWAGRLIDFELNPDTQYLTVTNVIFPILSRHLINFRLIDEEEHFKFMFVTQSGPFRGYRNMPSSEILQFEQCEKDAIVKELLDGEEITPYAYETILD